MEEEEDRWSRELARLRPLLEVLARQNVHPRLWKAIDPSGVVQETLLEAHLGRKQYQGQGSPSLEVWVRRILLNNLYDALRRIHREKRDIDKEVSIRVAIDESTRKVSGQLSDAGSTPSEIVMKKEEVLILADALQHLDPDHRNVLELHYLQGRSLAELETILGRSQSAVAALLHRALRKLRDRMTVKKP